jgi:hypothetical protein
VAAVPAVDLIDCVHRSHPPLVINPEQQAPLPLGIRDDVGEKHSGLMVDEPWLVDTPSDMSDLHMECIWFA